MKRSLLILLALCTLLSFTSCANNIGAPPSDTGGGSVKPDDNFEFTPPDDNPKSNIQVDAWTTHSFVKTSANGAIPSERSTSYKVYMAKGETEGCQIVFRANTSVGGLSLKCTHQNESTLDYKIHILDTNYSINGSLLPDPASVYTEGSRITARARVSLPFLIEFTSKGNTEAGHYPYVFELRDSSDKTVAQYVVIVRVWDITRPEKLSYQSSIGISSKDITTFFFGHETKITEEAYLNYYNLLLEHNLSAQDLPYDILDERADAYMSDPRVTAFRVPHDVSDEKLLEYYTKLKSNTKWLKKAYFMPATEPDTLEELENFCLSAMHLQSICPAIKITSPIAKDIQVDVLWDQINAMKGWCTLWCPKLCLWDDEMSYGDHDYVHSMSFEARMRKMMDESFGVWTYLNHTPGGQYTSLSAGDSGYNQRVLFWQQYQRGIHGLIYWSSTAWNTNRKVNPWDSLDTGLYDATKRRVYGDGILFYPGNEISATPTVSIRMKIMRDGIDDMELLMMAAKTLGNKWVNEKVNSITSSLTSIEATEDAFVQIRIEIGNALEKALP